MVAMMKLSILATALLFYLTSALTPRYSVEDEITELKYLLNDSGKRNGRPASHSRLLSATSTSLVLGGDGSSAVCPNDPVKQMTSKL